MRTECVSERSLGKGKHTEYSVLNLAGIRGEGLSYLENSICMYSFERFKGNISCLVC